MSWCVKRAERADKLKTKKKNYAKTKQIVRRISVAFQLQIKNATNFQIKKELKKTIESWKI